MTSTATISTTSSVLDVERIRKEARVIAILLLRRDRMLRLGAVALGGSIILSSLALVRFLL